MPRTAAALISRYAIVSHLAHLMLAIALMCVLAAARLVTRSSGLRIRVAPVAAVIGYALLLQLGAPAYLYGRLMLSQDFVPFLLARAVHDSTVEPHLRSVCGKRRHLRPRPEGRRCSTTRRATPAVRRPRSA